MATKQSANTVLRRFGAINVEFFRNNMQKVSDFGRCEVTSFHFEEGISYPYSGTLNLITQNAINFGKLDLNYLYVKISYQINYIYKEEPEEYNIGDVRTVWALIKTVTNLPKEEKINPYDAKEKFYYQYQLSLESPLARLKNKQTIFSELEISQILCELLSRGGTPAKTKDAKVYNPLLCKLDISKIQHLSQFDTKTLKIQRGQENTLSFFNRILIAYGINYVFEFDEQNGVKIIFSCDQDYKKKSVLSCTNDLNLAGNNLDYVYLANSVLKKNSIQFDDARTLAQNLKNSWLNIEADRTDISGIKASQIKFIYKNLCIRSLAVNPKLSAHCVQDIRLEPGLILNSEIDDIKSRYLVENLITDITTLFKDKSKENTVQLKTDCLELADHPEFEELDDKADGDYFEFDSKKDLGCLVHQDLVNLEVLDSKQDVDILEAKACDKDGLVHNNEPAVYVDDKGKDNDLFYALLTGKNSNTVIEVHSLIDADSSTVKSITQGQRIMVLAKGGAYYLYGYVPHHLSVNDDKAEAYSKDIFNLGANSSISLKSYSSNEEYIYSLLKNSSQSVEDAVIMQALDSGNASLHDVTYLDKYRDNVKKEHSNYQNDLKNLQNALSALYSKYEDGHFLDSYINKDSSLTDNAPAELKYVKQCRDALNNRLESFKKLAKEIVDDCQISLIKEETKQIQTLSNKDGFQFSSDAGDHDISADNVVINGRKSITLCSPSITIKSSGSIKTAVGQSYIETKAAGTTINAGVTTLGYVPDEDGNNSAEFISSKFCVEGYNGISASAFNVSLNGNNQLSLNGPLGSGITLGYGWVKVVGSDITLQTLGKVEQSKNITACAIKTISDIVIASKGWDKETAAKIYKKTEKNVVTQFWDMSFGPTGSVQRIAKSCKTIKEGKLKSSEAGYIQARFGVVDSIVRALCSVVDYILKIIKLVFESIDIINNVEAQTLNPGDNLNRRGYEQAVLYITYIKCLWSLLGAGFKAAQGADGLILPRVSTISISSAKTEISSQKIINKTLEDTEEIAPLVGTVERPKIEFLDDEDENGDLNTEQQQIKTGLEDDKKEDDDD